MRLGFIGFGEAAFELSKGLIENGANEVYAYDTHFAHEVYNELILERVEQSKVTHLNSPKEVVDSADVIFITVPVDKTFDVYQSLKTQLRSGMFYVDLTASTPNAKKDISNKLKENNVQFIDGAIMGPVVMHGHRVPILISGQNSNELKVFLNNYGMKVSAISDNPGDASAIKLTRSIYMKGMSAVLIETLEAANEFGVSDYVIESLGKTLDSTDFKDTTNRLVTGTAIHSLRRSKELEGTISMLKMSGIDCSMTKSSKEKLEAVTNTNIREHFKSKTPKEWMDVISFLTDKKI